jgi:hypothetical protein
MMGAPERPMNDCRIVAANGDEIRLVRMTPASIGDGDGARARLLLDLLSQMREIRGEIMLVGE